jgi:hypothetical protein
MDHDQYHIETLGQLVDAKKEAHVLREQLVRSEESVSAEVILHHLRVV